VIGLSCLALWFLFIRLHGAARAGTVLVNLSIALTTTVLLLIGAEFALRCAFRDVSTTGDILSYFSTKWGRSVRYNSWGFRERDFDPKNRAGPTASFFQDTLAVAANIFGFRCARRTAVRSSGVAAIPK